MRRAVLCAGAAQPAQRGGSRIFPRSLPPKYAPSRSNAAFPWEPRTDMVVGVGLSYFLVPKFHFGFYG